LLHWAGGNSGLIHSIPGAGGWTRGRDLPAPEGRTFRDRYLERARSRNT